MRSGPERAPDRGFQGPWRELLIGTRKRCAYNYQQLRGVRNLPGASSYKTTTLNSRAGISGGSIRLNAMSVPNAGSDWQQRLTMPDISKRMEKAEKHLQKGRQDAALEEYLAALAEDPENEIVRQSAADLCVALGRIEDARRLLSAAFDRYCASGDVALASAAYKKLGRLGPPPVATIFRYGQLVEKWHPRDALDAYRNSAEIFLRTGDKARALMARKLIANLDGSIENLTRLANLASEMEDRATASSAWLKIAASEEAAGRQGLSWYERAHQIEPGDPKVVLAYGRALMSVGQADDAARVLGPVASTREASAVCRQLYGRALFASDRLAEAEPFIWEAYQAGGAQIDDVEDLIVGYLESGQHPQAVNTARRLEQHERRAGRYREFVALLQKIVETSVASVVFLEYLAEVFNGANREQEYCATLIQLFELYYAAGNFRKAASALDSAAELDAYEPGHERRLEMLRGKIDAHLFNAIGSRLTAVMRVEQQVEDDAREIGMGGGESSVLEDLMLQAEIFLQYSMRSKAVERLERIQKLFPDEHENMPKLRELYLAAGMMPSPGGASDSGVDPVFLGVEVLREPPPVAAPPSMDRQVEDFARISEITRNIYRQGNVKGVLFAAVNDIGRFWQSSRCVAALLTPGKPPSVALEYCAPGVKQSDIVAMVKLVIATQGIALSRGSVSLADAANAPEYASVRSQVELLGIRSLLAVPLMDAADHLGIIILQQCDRTRSWGPNDLAVLKTIADQMLLAVNNAKLRSLVRTLAVTEERSGLLKRSSYLDVLLSEVKRATEQNSTCSVLLMHFGKGSVLTREMGEAGVEAMMEEFGQLISSHIRQNDVAVRYEVTTIALILSDTQEEKAFMVVDKLRKLLTSAGAAGRSTPLTMTVGIAEVVIRSSWDPVDVVTELINRVDAALEAARAQGEDKVVALAPDPEGVVEIA